MKAWDKNAFPKVGYVAIWQEQPVVMGFLRLVEGNSAMIDGLCTNPSIPGPIRNEVIDVVVYELIRTAKSLKLTGIICFSEDSNTLTRSERFGFKRNNEKVMISLRLGD